MLDAVLDAGEVMQAMPYWLYGCVKGRRREEAILIQSEHWTSKQFTLFASVVSWLELGLAGAWPVWKSTVSLKRNTTFPFVLKSGTMVGAMKICSGIPRT